MKRETKALKELSRRWDRMFDNFLQDTILDAGLDEEDKERLRILEEKQMEKKGRR